MIGNKRVSLTDLGVVVGRAEAAYLRHMTELESAIRQFLLHYDDGGWGVVVSGGSKPEDEWAAAETMRALLPENDHR